MAWMAGDSDISVIIKRFPMCTDCNPKSPNLHGNAAAARAAIAAGIRGDEGFWQMHDWLFQSARLVHGPVLPRVAGAAGVRLGQFAAVMQSQARRSTRSRTTSTRRTRWGILLHADDLHQRRGTQGLERAQALTRAVQAVIAANPPPAEMASDRPLTALEKHLADWRERPVQPIPDSITRRALGPENAPVTVVVFGDYQEEGTREADGLMRLFAAGPDSNMKYVFAYFPVDQSCNPSTPVTRFAGGCRKAFAAEAADVMGGPRPSGGCTTGSWSARRVHRSAPDQEAAPREWSRPL